MDNLADILHARDSQIPPEIGRIKEFVRRRFDSEVAVSISSNQLIVSAASSSLAGAIRINLSELATAANTDKKIIIRIG